jgi:hypothetical protein
MFEKIEQPFCFLHLSYVGLGLEPAFATLDLYFHAIHALHPELELFLY